jgi:hypothetical protein
MISPRVYHPDPYDLTGSFWGAKSACEPVHIYWNENDDRIRVVNTSGKEVAGLHAEAAIYNLDGTRKSEQKVDVVSSPTAVADCFKLDFPADLSAVHFIKLRLTDAQGKLISENFYWRGTKYLDYTALNTLKPVQLAMNYESGGNGETETISADITNPANSGTVALAIRPKVVEVDSDRQILPVHASDGYFSLLPGETRHVTLEFDAPSASVGKPRLVLDCWNNAVNGNRLIYR